jgi:hypothetical protein
MKKPMKIRNIVVLALILLAVGARIFVAVGGYIAKARESEGETQLSSIYTAEKAFAEEYHEYSENALSIGYSPEGQLRGQVYISQSKLPADVARLIPADFLPYANKDGFRALYVKPGDHELKLFTINEKKEHRSNIVQIPAN